MKVANAIEQYLSAQRQRGLDPGSVRTTGHALRTVLAPVLTGEVEALGAEGVGDALRTALDQRRSRTSKKLLTPCTRELYVNAAAAFLVWCIGQGWIQSNPLGKAPAAPKAPTPAHLGTLIRRLREASGMTRQQFEEQTGLSATTIKGIDLGYHAPTAEQVRKLLAHPSMARLPAMARAAGLQMPQEDDGKKGGDNGGVGGGT